MKFPQLYKVLIVALQVFFILIALPLPYMQTGEIVAARRGLRETIIRVLIELRESRKALKEVGKN